MISQTAEYALRAMAQLALEPDTPQTSQQIASVTMVPLHYMSKVLQELTRAGLVHSQRGLHGGFTLMRKPEDLTIFDIVQAVDPLHRIKRCPLGIESHGETLCPLHRRLDDAMAQVEKSYRESNLAELLAEPSASKPLCRTAPESAS
jgi:Rrf2 family transcriptional regulator, nitric oxide-sensitive transcriptional repressor